MLQALRLAAVGALAVLCLSSAVQAEFIATPDFTQGDAEKGKQVYQRVGVCVNCHGWAGDGESGRNPMVARGRGQSARNQAGCAGSL